MSPVIKNRELFEIGFPRVSGDEPDAETLEIRLLVFSPRERG